MRWEPDPDLEDNGDLEPSLGAYTGRQVDAELDDSDREPSLGSLDRAMDQTRWAECAAFGAGDERELDRSDYEDGHDAEPSLGWANRLGARVDEMCRLMVERVPTKRIRRQEIRP